MLATFASPEKVLCQHEVLGTAFSNLPEGYDGPCVVQIEGRTLLTPGFPSVEHAVSAAKFAVGVLGGFMSARVVPCSLDDVTHETWIDWAF